MTPVTAQKNYFDDKYRCLYIGVNRAIYKRNNFRNTDERGAWTSGIARKTMNIN